MCECLTFIEFLMQTLTITAKGQVTLRKSLLKHLGVTPGSLIAVEALPNGQLSIRSASQGNWASFFGCLHDDKTAPISIEAMNEAISDAWAART